MGRKLITYWRTDGSKFAFYNLFKVLKGLGCKPVESIPFNEWFPLEDDSYTDRWAAIKKVCNHFDKNYTIHDGHYFTCSDGNCKKDPDWTFVTVNDSAINTIVEPHVPRFKLKKSKLWCVQCTAVPELREEDDEYEDDNDIYL